MRFVLSRLITGQKSFQNSLLIASSMAMLFAASPVWAHHAMGGRLPSNGFEGFLSGLAHPLIGVDHFAFIVAVGLLAATKQRGIVMPIVFVLTALLGTGLHLMQLTIPLVELVVSGSILLIGVLLTMPSRFNVSMGVGLAAVAGLFHGYAYGEAIIGAEMTPLTAYLLGFTVIQLIVALLAFFIARLLLRSPSQPALRLAGFVVCGIGVAFFATQIVGILFPV